MFSVNGKANEPMGIVNNPLANSPFSAGFDQGGIPIPPTSEFRITDAGEFRITDMGDHRITD